MIYTTLIILSFLPSLNPKPIPYEQGRQEKIFIDETYQKSRAWYFNVTSSSKYHGQYKTSVLYIRHPLKKKQYEVQVRHIFYLCDYCFDNVEFIEHIPNDWGFKTVEQAETMYGEVLNVDKDLITIIRPELVKLYRNRVFEHSYWSYEPLDEFYRIVKGRLND